MVSCTGRRLELWYWDSDLKSILELFHRAVLKTEWERREPGWGFFFFVGWVSFQKGALPCKKSVSGNPVPFMLSFMNFSLSHFLLMHSMAPFLVMRGSGSLRSSVCGCKYCGNISSSEHSDNAFADFLIKHLFFPPFEWDKIFFFFFF